MTGVSASCGACKFLRRKCTNECVFAPYFSYDEATIHFSAVHKVFGASNFSRLLLRLPQQHRSEAAISGSYEALARIRDPVYGCVSYIFALQQQVANLQEEIEILGTNMSIANANNLINPNTGDVSTNCQEHQSNNNFINNNNNNSSSISQSSSSFMNLQEHHWNNSNCSNHNYQQHEQVVPSHAENHGALSNNHGSILMLPQSMPICEWESQNDMFGIISDPKPQESSLVEGLLNHQDIFYSDYQWLVN